MNPDKIPTPENELHNPNLEAQDEELTSGGNNRLIYILVGVILAFVIGYVALPKGNGSKSTGLASVTPTFMLDDAAVTAPATAPAAAADSVAAGPKAAPKTDEAADDAANQSDKSPAKTIAPARAIVVPAAPAVAVAPASTPTAEAAPIAPVVVPEPVAPAAPTSVTLSGKIEDENGKPLIGATVLLRGSSKATSTDANGTYTLEIPAGTDNTLVYGYGGYDDEEVRSRGAQPVNVTLTPRAKTKKRR